MAKVPAPFLEHLRSERETGQNFGLIVTIVAEERFITWCNMVRRKVKNWLPWPASPSPKDRRPGPRGDILAEEFELDPSITAAGGTTMVMATMALVTLMHGGPWRGPLEGVRPSMGTSWNLPGFVERCWGTTLGWSLLCCQSLLAKTCHWCSFRRLHCQYEAA